MDPHLLIEPYPQPDRPQILPGGSAVTSQATEITAKMKDAEKEPPNDGADGHHLPPPGPPLTAAGKGLANFSTYSAWAASTSWCPLKMISTAPYEKRKGFPRVGSRQGSHQFLTANQSKETGHAWGYLSCSGAEEGMLDCGSRSLHSPSARLIIL